MTKVEKNLESLEKRFPGITELIKKRKERRKRKPTGRSGGTGWITRHIFSL